MPIASQVKACPKIQRAQEIGIAFPGFAVIIIKSQHLIWDISNLTAADANKTGNVGERVRVSVKTRSLLSVSCLRTHVPQDGYPKKIGRISLTREGDGVAGWAERHGVRFCEMGANLTGKFNTEDAQDVFAGVLGSSGKPLVVAFNFKYFPSPGGAGFDFPPRLIREEVEFGPRSIQIGEGEVALHPSDFDPWAEVEVVRVLGALYTVGNNSMQKGAVVAEVDPSAFEPYAFLKWDF